MHNSHDKAESIYSNLELHGRVNLLCYSAHAEKQNKTMSPFSWLDNQAVHGSMQREADTQRCVLTQKRNSTASSPAESSS